MMKLEKHKDAKAKEKQDTCRSAQNILYLLPDHEDSRKSFTDYLLKAEIDKIQSIYETELDTGENLPFFKTYHNMCRSKDGKISYRSPYSNQYFPSIEDGVYPSPPARNIEEKGRLLFEEYSKLYFGSNYVANFFVQESQEQFCFAFFVQKKYNDEIWEGIWNSTNVANISGDPSKSITYKVTSSVIYDITSKEIQSNLPFNISGNLKKTKNETKKLSPGEQLDEVHLSMIGKLIEDNETFLRQQIDSIFVRKTKDIVDKTRISESVKEIEERKKNIRSIMQNKNAQMKET